MRKCAVFQDLGILLLASRVGEAYYFMVFVTRGTFNVARLPSISPLHRPSVRPTATEEGATWSRPPPPWGSRGRRAAECSRGAGQRGASERLSLGWLLNRNLKAILTSISLHVDDKSLHVSTSKSGVSILKRTLIVEGCLHPDSLQGSYSHCPLIYSYRRYRKFRG